MSTVPTIKIRRDNERGYRIINLSSFNPAVHEAFDAAPAPEPASEDPALSVGKGPQGKWYVKQGKERISEAFETEAEALAAKAAIEA